MIAALASLLALLAAAPSDAPEAPIPAPAAAPQPATEPVPVLRIGPFELAPAFVAGTPAAEGKAAYDAGQHAEAVVKLARAPQPEAAYVRALALVELGRHAEALLVLGGLEARLPELADRLRFLEGKALAGAGRREEALAAWAAVPDGSLLAPEARLAQARLASALGDREAALAALSPLLGLSGPADLSRPDAAATALLLAGRLRAAGKPGDPAGARRDLLACWAAHPLAPEAVGVPGCAPCPAGPLRRGPGAGGVAAAGREPARAEPERQRHRAPRAAGGGARGRRRRRAALLPDPLGPRAG